MDLLPADRSIGNRRVFGRLVPVFFPPLPPPLGMAPSFAERRVLQPNAREELAEFVNEPFYAPLSARLASREAGAQLDGEQERRLESFRANKTALQTELKARLYTLRESDPAARRQALEAFAREQTPQLIELERTAEDLRSELARATDAGNAFRPGNLARSGSSPAEGLADPTALLRWAVFYSPGLSSAQRRLVREILIELGDPAPEPGPAGRGAGWMFFSPETARVSLPSPLPADVADKIAEYETTKNALKRELRNALGAPDLPAAPVNRAQVLQTLARSQAPRIAATEALAEEIRRGLQGSIRDSLGVPRLPPLPANLEERIDAYRKNKLDLQKELLAQVHGIAGREAGAGTPAGQDRLRQTIAAFTRDHAARYAALEKEKEGIRAELARLGGDRTAETAPGPAADGLIKNFTDSFQQYERWRLYYEYRIAVFEPGLSPEQRRLLFDAGIEKLALPLPGGTLQSF